MNQRLVLLFGAAVLAAVLAPTLAATAKESDPAKVKAARDAVRKELKEKKGMPFFDLSYYVDGEALKESRWTQTDPPPFSGVKEDEGGQFFCTFKANEAAEGEPDMKVVAIKMRQKVTDAGKTSTFSYPFKATGKSVDIAKVDAMAQGFYDDFMASAADIVKDKCKPPKKVKIGVAEYFAYAVGKEKEAPERQRKEWYVWGQNGATPPCTWLLEVTYNQKSMDNEDRQKLVSDLAKNVKEINDKRLK